MSSITRQATHTLFLFCALAAGSAVAVETVDIPASADATLVEDPAGSRANGAGPVMFAGRTNETEDFRRRAVIHFDVAAAVPAGAVITGATLALHLGQGNSTALADLAVHRLLQPWREGPSYATGGGGADAQPGEVTWLFREFEREPWRFPGGDYAPAASTSVPVKGSGFYTWQDSPLLTADVRRWARVPSRNFGWVLIGDEATPQSAKRIDTRESETPAFRPVLTVQYEQPGTPSSSPMPRGSE